ncbi:acyl-CoA dehydrogenase [Bifidobacterium longum]|uniref:Acyl-CoA dehydrogenase n=1 Tax=Bifidobacterium longum TaxID=216816 RepID=A0A2U2RS39_BIFLN|nr:acyl-CoA dehydrogenase [Bifidobacterium longum]
MAFLPKSAVDLEFGTFGRATKKPCAQAEQYNLAKRPSPALDGLISLNLCWLGEPNFGNALARTSTNGLWFTDD